MNPLCRVCGKPVPKVSQRVSFGCRHDTVHTYFKSLTARPADLAEAVRLAGNGEVIRVGRTGRYGDGAQAADDAVTELTLWRGEYAWDGHFNAQGCAAEFGQWAAGHLPDYAMPAYREAMAKRAAKEDGQ
jgi:hypothetical protein